MNRRRPVRAALLTALLLPLCACSATSDPAAGSTVPAPTLPAAVVAAAAGARLIVEPDAGPGALDAELAAPRRSLDLEIYELDDPSAEAVLAADAGRGVAVRVILDSRLERVHNAAAYDFLRSRGVQVAWASRRYSATHEKSFVLDGTTLVVMSLNLASRYYATTRDIAVVDPDPRDAAAFEQVFAADFAGRGVGTPAGDDLVWSPAQSQADLVALIDGARHVVLVESEEFSSRAAVGALVRAARRGVAVTVVMTDQAGWHRGFGALTAAGGRVCVLYGEHPLYIHAKLLVTDPGTGSGRAFVGSQNLSSASLLHDRELGIVLTAPALVTQVAAVVRGDAALGTVWR